MTLRSRFRLFTLVLALCVAAVVVYVVTTPRWGRGATEQEIYPATRAIQVAAEHLLQDEGRLRIADFLAQVVQDEPRILRIRMFDASGRVVAVGGAWATNEGVSRETILRRLNGEGAVETGLSSRSEMVELSPLGGAATGALEVVFSSSRVPQLALIAVLALSILGFVVGVDRIVARQVVQPMARLMQAVRGLTAGRADTALASTKTDELNAVTRALDDLCASLERRRREEMVVNAALADLHYELRRRGELGFAGKVGSAVAHELSTPLNVISGRATLASRTLPQDSPALEHLDAVRRQVEKIATTMQTLLAPLRLPEPRLVPKRLDGLIQAIVPLLEHLARARGVTLTTRLTPEPLWASADAEELTFVVARLAVDAIDRTPAGGRIALETRPGQDAHRRLVEVSIADGGDALSPEAAARIFDSPSTVHAAGRSGSLAWATARDIARRHGGDLRIDSEPGVGTTFTLAFPVPEEVAA